MVLRANNRFPGIGGHLSTYASSASLYEVGFNHFFRGKDGGAAGDQIFYQGHAAPGIYARAFLEGRLSEDQLDHFRREGVPGQGLSSYPHPRLMPDFWEYPTVSMGLGPISAIYQARFNRYLQNRGHARHVELARLGVPRRRRDRRARVARRAPRRRARGARQPDLRRQLQPAAARRPGPRQRQDHPGARGGLPRLRLERHQGHLGARVGRAPGARRRRRPRPADERHARRRVPEVQRRRRRVHPRALLRARTRGCASSSSTCPTTTSPSCAAAATTIARSTPRTRPRPSSRARRRSSSRRPSRAGPSAPASRPATSPTRPRSCPRRSCAIFRDRLELPIPDEKLKDAPYYHPGPEVRGGRVPARAPQGARRRDPQAASSARSRCRRRRPRSTPSSPPAARPPVSTTMVFTRILRNLIRDKELGPRIVPIIPDEARTFGMDPLFKEVGIYAALGQRYEPVDSDLVLSYREATDGQVLEEGITEAGSMAVVPGGRHVVRHARPGDDPVLHLLFDVRLPADRRPDVGVRRRPRPRLPHGRHGRPDDAGRRGPAARRRPQPHPGRRPSRTSAATTRRSPTSSPRSSATASSGCTCKGEDVFYYITLYNENYAQPAEPDGLTDEGILRGIYRFAAAPEIGKDAHRARLVGSGCDPRAGRSRHATCWPSGSAWRPRSTAPRRSRCCAAMRSRPSAGTGSIPMPASRGSRTSARCCPLEGGPIVAATDWIKALPDMVARWLPDALPLARHGRLRAQRDARGPACAVRDRPAAHRRRARWSLWHAAARCRRPRRPRRFASSASIPTRSTRRGLTACHRRVAAPGRQPAGVGCPRRPVASRRRPRPSPRSGRRRSGRRTRPRSDARRPRRIRSRIRR